MSDVLNRRAWLQESVKRSLNLTSLIQDDASDFGVDASGSVTSTAIASRRWLAVLSTITPHLSAFPSSLMVRYQSSIFRTTAFRDHVLTAKSFVRSHKQLLRGIHTARRTAQQSSSCLRSIGAARRSTAPSPHGAVRRCTAPCGAARR